MAIDFSDFQPLFTCVAFFVFIFFFERFIVFLGWILKRQVRTVASECVMELCAVVAARKSAQEAASAASDAATYNALLASCIDQTWKESNATNANSKTMRARRNQKRHNQNKMMKNNTPIKVQISKITSECGGCNCKNSEATACATPCEITNVPF